MHDSILPPDRPNFACVSHPIAEHRLATRLVIPGSRCLAQRVSFPEGTPKQALVTQPTTSHRFVARSTMPGSRCLAHRVRAPSGVPKLAIVLHPASVHSLLFKLIITGSQQLAHRVRFLFANPTLAFVPHPTAAHTTLLCFLLTTATSSPISPLGFSERFMFSIRRQRTHHTQQEKTRVVLQSLCTKHTQNNLNLITTPPPVTLRHHHPRHALSLTDCSCRSFLASARLYLTKLLYML